MTTTAKSRLTMLLVVAVVMNTVLLACSFFQIAQLRSTIEQLRADAKLHKDGRFIPLATAAISTRQFFFRTLQHDIDLLSRIRSHWMGTMREFFHGWKRKVGCITLVSACVFAGLWLRSYRGFDFIEIPVFEHSYEVVISSPGSVIWSRTHLEESEDASSHYYWITRTFQNSDDLLVVKEIFGMLETDDEGHTVGWSCCGFGFSEHPNPRLNCPSVKRWIIPYWSLVLPPTLVSAWLLFSKPRQRKPIDPEKAL